MAEEMIFEEAKINDRFKFVDDSCKQFHIKISKEEAVHPDGSVIQPNKHAKCFVEKSSRLLTWLKT